MKKLLSMVLLLALVTPQAYASKARLLALGMDEIDNEGSYYIDDVRNIFLNVANVNNYSDTLIFEWGDEGNALGDGRAALDNDDDPKAQGGFLMNSGSFVFGAYLGNESNTSSLLKIASSSQTSLDGGGGQHQLLQTTDNQIDLFLGSEASGVQWGMNVLYSSSEEESQNSEDEGYAVRFGAIGEKWNTFANIGIGSNSKRTFTVNGGGTHEFDGSLGLHIGGGYDIHDDARVYGYVKNFGWDQKDTTASTANQDVEGEFTIYSVGYGYTKELSDGTLYTDLSFKKKDIEIKYSAKAEASNTLVPLTIGYEAEATSWLKLRGSVTQNLYGKRNNDNYDSLNDVVEQLAIAEFGADSSGKDATIRDTTDVRAGASLMFGDLTVDGLLGTTTDGSLNFDEAMTRVGATYSF